MYLVSWYAGRQNMAGNLLGGYGQIAVSLDAYETKVDV